MANLAAHVHLTSGGDWHRVLTIPTFSLAFLLSITCLYQWADVEFPVMPAAVVFSRNTLLVTEKIPVPLLFEPWQTANSVNKRSQKYPRGGIF